MLEPPLPFGNAASRWFYVLLKGLEERGHQVTTLVATEDLSLEEKTRQYFSESSIHFFSFHKDKGLASKLRNWTHPHDYKTRKLREKGLRQFSPDNFDVIHVEQTWSGWATQKNQNKTLINVHHLQGIDLENRQPKTLKEKLLQSNWSLTEKRILSNYSWIRTCSPRLNSRIQKWNPKAHIKTVPVGMDPSLYHFASNEDRERISPNITLIGNMNWYPSISAAQRLLESLWPRIKEQVPEAKCRIIGWQARSNLKNYLAHKDVEILENVPDIKPHFESSGLLLYAPARGSGMKIKILEAMLFGIPVVTTSEGIEGLPAKDQVHCGLSDNNDTLIQRAVELLNSKELQNCYRQEARKLVEDHCSPTTTVESILEMYQEITRANQ